MVLEGVTGFRMTTQAAEFGDRLAGLEGRVVHAKVLDVQGAKVTLRVEGQVVTAESEVPLQPRAEVDLMVRGVEGGRITMQVVASEGKPIRPLTDSAISSRLMGIDIAPSRLSIAAARALIAHDMPVTKENVQALLTALPPDATEEQVAFQTSALRAAIPPAKEFLALQVLLQKHLDSLPAEIREVFKGLADAPGRAAGTGARELANILERLSLLPLAPDSESADEVAGKLAEFARSILLPTEARLTSALLSSQTAAPRTPLNTFVESILLVLLSLSKPADKGDAAEAMRNIQTAVAEMEQLPLEDMPLIKDSGQLQAQVRETTAALRERMTELEAAIAKNDMPRAEEILQQVRLQMQRLVSAFGAEARERINTFPEAVFSDHPQAASGQTEIFALVRDIAQQAAQTGDPEKLRELFQEILLRVSLQILPRAAEAAADPATRVAQAVRDVLSWLVEAARVAAESAPRPAAEQMPRLQALVAELNNLIERAAAQQALPPAKGAEAEAARLENDLRLMLGQVIRSADTGEGLRDASASLARNLQLASFASAVQHTGFDPTGAVTVFFPINFGDRVDIGILKIRTDPERKKNKKPVDPFNASVVLILDTEFLGLSATHLTTYPKSLQCVIEVDTKRKQAVLERHIGELDEALRATVYENVKVEARVRRRKAAGKPPPAKKQTAAVDFKI